MNMSTSPNTNDMLEHIQQELRVDPYENHRSIAVRLGIEPRVVAMVCRNTHLPCRHGNPPKPRMSGGVKQRQAAITISDADWEKFKAKHPSAATRLGEMIREDIK
jgi:hypothetical protein